MSDFEKLWEELGRDLDPKIRAVAEKVWMEARRLRDEQWHAALKRGIRGVEIRIGTIFRAMETLESVRPEGA